MVMPEDFGDEVVFTGDGQRYNVNTYICLFTTNYHTEMFTRDRHVYQKIIQNHD